MDKLQYVPIRVHDNLKTNRSIREGFTNLYRKILQCIRAKTVTTKINVLSALRNKNDWPLARGNFLKRDSLVSSVALILFQAAMEQDELSGSEDIQRPNYSTTYMRIDQKFGFVRHVTTTVYQTVYESARTGEPIEDELNCRGTSYIVRG